LRERLEDLGIFVGVILRGLSAASEKPIALSGEAGLALLRYRWPRNIRELERCLARAAAVAESGLIEVEHLPDAVRGTAAGPSSGSEDSSDEDDNASECPGAPDDQHAQLVRVLTQSGGNVSAVAQKLGTSRLQVYRLMRRFGIEPRAFRQ
jgi:transcriptional regulator of acetoin/glycerol metabolism